MKNLPKMAGISMICALLFLGFATHASTGDTTTGAAISYTWSLLTYLNTQENAINSSFTTSYGKIYALFTKTWLNILKSVEYQSLVCLGAIKDESLLSQLQKSKTAFMISFKKDFIELENQILALEEKQDLQKSDNVNVFDSGTTYESEKATLKELIDAKVKLHKGFIANFETGYIAKNTEFLSMFQQYSAINKDLIKGIQDKMAKVQGVITAFSWVELIINIINAKITGLDNLIQKMEDAKNKWLDNLDKALQPLIDANSKKYKKLQTLVDELTQQKTYVVGQYQMDFDEYLTKNLQTRYDRSQYLALKDQINSFKAKFYTTTNQLNCSNILSPTDESAALLAKINSMKTAVNSWWAKIEKDGISAAFKDQLYSGFQSLYIQKFKQRYAEYANYVKEYIKVALRNFIASLVPTMTTDTTASAEKATTYVFTKPFKSGEYNEGIKALQNLLVTLQLYSWAIDGIYNKATKNAVYQFQLSKWLLKGYENKPSVWWRMWPATRNALNNATK